MKLINKLLLSVIAFTLLSLTIYALRLQAEPRSKYIPRPKVDFSINVFPTYEVNFIKNDGDETIRYQVKGITNRYSDGLQIVYSRDSDKPLEKRLIRLLRADYSITWQNGAISKDKSHFDLNAQTKVYWDDHDRYLALLEEIHETLAMLFDSKDFAISGNAEEEIKRFYVLTDTFDTFYQILTGQSNPVRSAE